MKLEKRFIFIFLSLFLGVIGLIFLQYTLEVQRSRQIIDGEITQQKATFVQIVNLEGKSLATLSRDYSFWDDMVAFVDKPTKEFENTINASMETFAVDKVWVYSQEGKQVYYKTSSDSSVESTITFTPQLFDALKKKKFLHYYTKDKDKIYEIRAATIVPETDLDHTTEARGYWVIARAIDEEYIGDISRFTASQLNIQSALQSGKDAITGDSFSFVYPLKDWDGRAIAQLHSSFTIPALQQLSSEYRKDLIGFTAVGLLFFLIMVIALWRLVLRPLGIISNSIRTQTPGDLVRLTMLSTEFGDLARTMITFFEQKAKIAKDEFQRTELERLNREKTAFLAVAAHEMIGPVSKVKTFSEFLEYTLKSNQEMTGDVGVQVERIKRQVRRMSMLINDLKAASEGNEELTFSMSEFDFDNVIRQEVDQAGFSLEHSLEIQGETCQTLHSDPERIGQALNNLIRNAAKYSPDADKIIVHLSVKDKNVVVAVEDFGIGVSAEDQPHLFDRFYRAASVKDDYKGLGLGLSIVKQISDHLGGKIWIESEIGKGSTFYMSFPLTSSESVAVDTTNS